MLPNDYGVLCLSFLLLGFGDAFVLAYSALAAMNIVLLSLALPKWYREIRDTPARQ